MQHRRFIQTTSVAAAAGFVGVTSAAIQYESVKLLPLDGAADDWFGHAVALSGGTALVGAYRDDDNGFQSGSAYTFDTATGLQLGKLWPDDGAAGDSFAFSVAIEGARSVVGAFGADGAGTDSGAAYGFNANGGSQAMTFLPDDAAIGDRCGVAVAISGSTAIVGARSNDDHGLDSGAAYTFNAITGNQIAKLLPDDGGPNDIFGSAVGISGVVAVVGAPKHDAGGANAGAAYVFDAGSGDQTAKLLPVGGAAGDEFGAAVDIDGGTVIVGARYDDAGGADVGAAYLFNAGTGQHIATLLPEDGEAFDYFGTAVAISGGTAVVGAPFDDDNGTNAGAVYVFDVATGLQVAKLLASDGTSSDELGHSVAISDGAILVGARTDDDNGISSGSAYIFAVPALCIGDTGGDGTTDFNDLNLVLGDWGCGLDTPGPCPGDTDNDGVTDFNDLNRVLSDWECGL